MLVYSAHAQGEGEVSKEAVLEKIKDTFDDIEAFANLRTANDVGLGLQRKIYDQMFALAMDCMIIWTYYYNETTGDYLDKHLSLLKKKLKSIIRSKKLTKDSAQDMAAGIPLPRADIAIGLLHLYADHLLKEDLANRRAYVEFYELKGQKQPNDVRSENTKRAQASVGDMLGQLKSIKNNKDIGVEKQNQIDANLRYVGLLRLANMDTLFHKQTRFMNHVPETPPSTVKP